jgi:hypothetical protein
MRRYLLPTLFIATLSATAAHAVPMSCPTTQHSKALTTASLFDGPPEAMADLRPNEGPEKNGLIRTWWSLADIHKAGRQPHVVCGYTGGGTLVLKPGKTVKTCFRYLQTVGKAGEYRVRALRCE